MADKFYRVDCWIQVPNEEVDDNEIFTNREDALAEVDHCEAMQPENRYEVVECTEGGSDLD